MAVKTSWAAGDVLTAADLTDTFAAKYATPGAWTSWTPTVAGYTGTIGTVTINAAKYMTVGKLVVARVDVTFAPGTAATGITITLPSTAVAAKSGNATGIETNVTGWTLGGNNDTTGRMYITKYDGTAPWSGTGNNRIVGTFFYEAA